VGRGRFSVVRRCQEIMTGREVAVKFVNRRKQGREETRREFELLSRLSHPGIVAASGLFLTASSDAIVMDLVFGPPLIEWLCETPSYTEATLSTYVTQLLSALAYLHSKETIHLDLRPENILLEADTVTLRLVDLGEAQGVRKGREGMNMAGPLLHNGPEFLAPEVLSLGPVGPYSDMWAVGVLLYVLFSGVSPFHEESEGQSAASVLRGQLAFPGESWDKVSTHARNIVTRLLVINPCQRISAASCLSSSWFLESRSLHSPLSSRHLATFVARRQKRLSTNGPSFSRLARPDSLHRKLPS